MYINNNNKQAINITNSNVKGIDFRKLQNSHGNISFIYPGVSKKCQEQINPQYIAVFINNIFPHQYLKIN